MVGEEELLMPGLQGLLDRDIAGSGGSTVLGQHDPVHETILRGVGQRARVIDEIDMFEGGLLRLHAIE